LGKSGGYKIGGTTGTIKETNAGAKAHVQERNLLRNGENKARQTREEGKGTSPRGEYDWASLEMLEKKIRAENISSGKCS